MSLEKPVLLDKSIDVVEEEFDVDVELMITASGWNVSQSKYYVDVDLESAILCDVSFL